MTVVDLWKPLRAFLRAKMFGEGTLTEGEVVPFYSDVPADVVAHIKSAGVR